MRQRLALKGYSFVILLCVWAFAAPFSWYLAGSIGWFALYIWLAANLLVAFWLNQSRTHSGKNRFDDRLPPERVAKAQEDYINEVLETRSGPRKDAE
ncbi:MAG TPA: hypothetical protein VGS11_04425 [Candidatus Bathyarchaeia archaeon]|nr:hypothetical protein [Candidatus Bathyarchaeia archaeon]